MAIPKQIFQTFKTQQLPLLTRYHIYRLKRKNPEYEYHFYDDVAIDQFIQKEFDEETYQLFKRINIGAAKADFFRYAVLYKYGGVYLDIDSLITKKLDDFLLNSDSAVISYEENMVLYIQFALFFDKGHPFLKKTLEVIIQNLKENKYPYNVHAMTGPTAFTEGVNRAIQENKEVNFRLLGMNYNEYVTFSYRMSKTFLYGFSRKNHWKKLAETTPVLKPS